MAVWVGVRWAGAGLSRLSPHATRTTPHLRPLHSHTSHLTTSRSITSSHLITSRLSTSHTNTSHFRTPHLCESYLCASRCYTPQSRLSTTTYYNNLNASHSPSLISGPFSILSTPISSPSYDLCSCHTHHCFGDSFSRFSSTLTNHKKMQWSLASSNLSDEQSAGMGIQM